MKTRKIKNISYVEYENGVLVPACLVFESPRKIRTPKDILPLLEAEKFLKQETVILFTLDGNNQVIKKHVISLGLANQSPMHPRECFAPAIEDRAVSIFLAHNHPSGNTDPSEADLVATKRMVDVSKIMGIPLLDHIIISQNGFTSLRERHPFYFN